MSKTKEELLLDYKRSNKVRRVSIIIKAGFSNETDYLASLMEADSISGSPQAAGFFKHNKKVEERPVIHNIHIIDISGSMAGAKLAMAIKGINEEVAELQKDETPVDYTHSLVEFSEPHHIKAICWKTPIKDTKVYHTHDRGSTALNQAVGETLEKLVSEDNKKDKVLVKIFTDGGENSSQGKYKVHADLKEFIKDCEGRGFTVTFIGTDYDVNQVIHNLGIHASNTHSHANTAETMYMASNTRGIATMNYAKKVLKKMDVSKGFYKDLKNKE